MIRDVSVRAVVRFRPEPVVKEKDDRACYQEVEAERGDINGRPRRARAKAAVEGILERDCLDTHTNSSPAQTRGGRSIPGNP